MAGGARIAVFGAGYAGLVTGAGFAELGHEVVVRDVVPDKIEALRAGRLPIYEPGLDRHRGPRRLGRSAGPRHEEHRPADHGREGSRRARRTRALARWVRGEP